MPERVRVPAFDELPLPPVPRVLAPHERERLYRPRRERRRLERPCARCGIPIGQHATCPSCGALVGRDHPIAPYLIDGRCPGCRGLS
jgi:hypothetical protein